MKAFIGIAAITGLITTAGIIAAHQPSASTVTATPVETASTVSDTTEPMASPELAPITESEAEPDAQPISTTPECDPNYKPCVPVSSADLNCPDVAVMVQVIGTDIHRFDRDGDGFGCESYAR